MLARMAVVFALLLISMIPLKAGSIGVDEMCGGTPQVGSGFSFVVPTPVDGTSSLCLTPTVPFRSLTFVFAAPPAVPVTCGSAVFLSCSVSETGNIDDVSFQGGAGIPAGVDFRIVLQGFATGQTISAQANVPEPDTLLLAALAALAISFVERAKLRRTHGKPVSDADR
jgi:hypothetical protein